jgi:glycosyltransferase involved in cell wall biosynthesis
MGEMTRLTKVLFFIHDLQGGGGERTLLNLIQHLDQSQFRPQLVIATGEGPFLELIPKDLPFFNLQIGKGRTSLAIPKLAALLKKEKPDIAVGYADGAARALFWARLLAGVHTRVVASMHNTYSKRQELADYKNLRRFFVAQIFPRLHCILAVSEGVKDDLITLFPSLAEKIVVIHNPVVTQTLYNEASEDVKHPSFSSGNPVILNVAKLIPLKDQSTLIHAFSIIRRRWPARLVILGVGTAEPELMKLTHELGISESVDFLGFQSNPYKFMKRSSIFVLSSLQEGLPTVLIEAMACGIPVISTDCPSGPNEIISHRKNGILVPMQEPIQLAKAIEELLERPDFARELACAGQLRAESFRADKITREYERFFLSVLNGEAYE